MSYKRVEGRGDEANLFRHIAENTWRPFAFLNIVKGSSRPARIPWVPRIHWVPPTQCTIRLSRISQSLS